MKLVGFVPNAQHYTTKLCGLQEVFRKISKVFFKADKTSDFFTQQSRILSTESAKTIDIPPALWYNYPMLHTRRVAMHIRFEYASKSALPTLLPQLFSLLYANMNEIAPTGNTYEQDYAHWHASVAPAMQKPQRQIALMYDGAHPCGYFQYYVNATTFMMEEIQIEKPYQGSGIFSSFFSSSFSLMTSINSPMIHSPLWV